MPAETLLAHALAIGLLTSAFVGLLMFLLARLGPRASGFGAALQLFSVPVLLLLSLEQDGSFAASAAEASLWVTTLVALAVQAYGWVSLRLRTSLAVLLAALLTLLCAALSAGWARLPAVTLALTALLAAAPLPRPLSTSTARPDPHRIELWLAIGFAGATAALVDWLGPRAGPAWSGVIPALPIVGLCGLWASHARGGVLTQNSFLRGYMDGMFAKAAFLAVAALALRAGFGVSALAFALVAGVLAMFLQNGLRRRRIGYASG